MPWFKDLGLRWALLVGFWLRMLPLARWQDTECVRDACAYLGLGRAMAEGQGMTLNTGESPWLWAPGYPAFLAAHERLFGWAEVAVVSQCLLAGVSQVLAYVLLRDHLDLRSGRAAAWLLGLSPTLAFFAGTFWTETLYITLLLALLLAVARAREVRRWALVAGGLLGLVMLVKGAATYMLPVLILGLVWGRLRQRSGWLSAGGLLLGAALVVAPYSAYASQKFGGFVLTERTLGHNLWVSYNDFPPNAFDWGVGVLDAGRTLEERELGRPRCDLELPLVEWDRCETRAALGWIRAHPEELGRRLPLRLAQLFNPNSFLTRHVRTGRWEGLSPALGEGLLLGTIGFSFVAVFGGLAGLLGRGRGWLPVTLAGLVAYHLAVSGLLTGLSRFRVPVDALLLLYAGALLADPRQTWAGLVGWRRWLALALGLALVPLMGWLLLPGYLP
jgi:4-amino-4-deoxy-L-arabinose transferase-like glycosyltransferase